MDTFLSEFSGRYTRLVAQPSTLCNVDCRYCYLPGRDRRSLMTVEVAKAIAQGIATQDAPYPVTLSWHGGEPLTTPYDHFKCLLEPLEHLRDASKVQHEIRSNATLIDDRWCELFAAYHFRVGVSIDGPRSLNANRRDWQGGEIFDRVKRGIERIKAHGLWFSVNCVVSAETIGRADELLAFLDELAPSHVGLSIEERENANLERPLVSRDDAERFWRAVIAHLRAGSRLHVREIARISRYVARIRDGADPRLRVESLPTVAFDGDVVVGSPELAGANAPEHENFVVGNVLRTPLSEIIAQLPRVRYVQEFGRGLAACQTSCSFWEYCGGALNPGNRYFEHGRMDGTETAHCRNSRQTPVTALLSLAERDPSADESLVRLLRRLAASGG